MSASYVLPPPDVPSLAVAGTDGRYPVRRVYCVGRNYAAHAREMGKAPDREPPFFFMKPADAVVAAGGDIPYPPLTQDLHHEVELVIAIGTGGSNIREADALDHIYGYAVGIDLTRRDLQGEAKKMARPWDWGKAFDAAAPCGPVVPAADAGHPDAGRIWLSVNGDVRQDGDLNEMIWSVSEIISICSQASRLESGDLIMTGTPAGVGVLVPGDKVAAWIEGVGEIAFAVAPPVG
ncbi:MAG: fumarylacetoacetate hydrolase family protein [Hyphomicrobiaceae bacterium]